MKSICEKAIEGNNYPKLNDDEQQVDVKHLKEQFDKKDKDEVQEITAAKKSNEEKEKKTVCETCNQTSVTEKGLKTSPGRAD